MIKPIKKKDVLKAKGADIPDRVIDVFNTFIGRNWDGEQSVVSQADVVKECKSYRYEADELFAKKWLDVEGLYRAAGWTVVYEKPAYNEPGDATWTFS